MVYYNRETNETSWERPSPDHGGGGSGSCSGSGSDSDESDADTNASADSDEHTEAVESAGSQRLRRPTPSGLNDHAAAAVLAPLPHQQQTGVP